MPGHPGDVGDVLPRFMLLWERCHGGCAEAEAADEADRQSVRSLDEEWSLCHMIRGDSESRRVKDAGIALQMRGILQR